MDANIRTPDELFGSHVRYVIPPFQRPYVWDEEDQWQPLWDDVARTAAEVLDVLDDGPKAVDTVPPHFLGAVVLQQEERGTGFIKSHSVVDGQQRLTTLQILFDAVLQVVAKHGDDFDVAGLGELVRNTPRAVQSPDEVFKVWPTRADRDAFRVAMGEAGDFGDQSESRIVQAHRFFRAQAEEWALNRDGDASELTDEEFDERVRRRLHALTLTLYGRLQLVSIDLTARDNPQVIFETLNDRGTPLLAADLVKNHVFRVADQANVDVEAWEREYWHDFGDDWWREQVTQGRHRRSRVDIFFQYWLIMRLQEEIATDQVFHRFRRFADDRRIHEPERAREFLAALRADADQFRSFADFAPESPEGTFYYRVVEALEAGVVTPVLLWLLAKRNGVPAEERARALAALESWIVRRTLLRLSTKDINKLVVALLKELHAADPAEAGQVVVDFLLRQTAHTRYWPDDDEVVQALSSVRLYGIVRQSRIRMVLEALEDHLRSLDAKTEPVRCPRDLQVEHVMPQKWREHWTEGEIDPAYRDRVLHSLGNLTLVTRKLNPALANLPWTDEEAARARPDARGKRWHLDQHSVLLLNRGLVQGNPDSWNERQITYRGRTMARTVAEIWPRG